MRSTTTDTKCFLLLEGLGGAEQRSRCAHSWVARLPRRPRRAQANSRRYSVTTSFAGATRWKRSMMITASGVADERLAGEHFPLASRHLAMHFGYATTGLADQTQS